MQLKDTIPHLLRSFHPCLREATGAQFFNGAFYAPNVGQDSLEMFAQSVLGECEEDEQDLKNKLANREEQTESLEGRIYDLQREDVDP